MTSRSSLQVGSPPPVRELVDGDGQAHLLGNCLGKGGEGAVYEVAGEEDFAAKIYHRGALDERAVDKLQAMTRLGSKEVEQVAAWPTSLLYEPRSQTVRGILMPRIVGARQLHELYGTTNRKRHFPSVLWHHMLLAARNVAAAFHSLHEAGVVVGDVNQGNLLVDTRMRVRFIDCDSFQISADGVTYYCPVATPHFTPGEMHGQNFRETSRTVDHDAFGLAVLIFHLVFVGRHPFAGRFQGDSDLPIEQAIRERRFAFSRDRAATQVDPPPASLSLDDLPPGLGQLFEAAFRRPTSEAPRPTSSDWVEQLDQLMSHRKACTFDDLHIYYDQLGTCPWCRIEEQGGPSFFSRDAGLSVVSDQRLAELDRRVGETCLAPYPELPQSRLAPPTVLRKKAHQTPAKLSANDAAATALAAGLVLCLATPWQGVAGLVGVAVAWLAGAYLLAAAEPRQRRRNARQREAELEKQGGQLRKIGRLIQKNYQKRRQRYEQAADEVRKTFAHYRAEGDELKEILKEHRSTHFEDFLREQLIRDAAHNIPGLSPPLVSMLESFGVETARDVSQVSLAGIPNVHAELVLELLQWRAQVEQQFQFQPDHGVTEQHLQVAELLATRRFKLVQARKVLMGASQLHQMARVGEAELNSALARFDELAGEWLKLAKEHRRHESRRRPLEREASHSVIRVVGLMIAAPVLAGLLWLLFG